ncbi:MAG: 6-phosphogluconolactonase [Bacteroidota bacterium]
MEIRIFKTIQELQETMAVHFIATANNAISLRGECNVVLSGGNSPQSLYSMLASPDFTYAVSWDKINFFFGDERYVPATDSRNNARMVKEILFDPLHISASKIFSINTNLSPDEAANEYADTIATHFKGGEVRFDLVLLGLGENAHTASLFPYSSVLNEQSASIKAVLLKPQNEYRITMTAAMINQSRHIAFLVYGLAKADAVHHVLEGEQDVKKYPAQLIHSDYADLRWYLDEAAASGLSTDQCNRILQ